MNDTIADWLNLYADALFSGAFHKTSSKEAAEDLVQETFLSAVKGCKNFKSDSTPKTWLFAILNNKVIDFYRKKAKSSAIDGKQSGQKSINQTNSFFDSYQNWTMSGKEVAREEEVHLLDDSEFNKILALCVNKLPDNWRVAVEFKIPF